MGFGLCVQPGGLLIVCISNTLFSFALSNQHVRISASWYQCIIDSREKTYLLVNKQYGDAPQMLLFT